jgi:bacterioferritin-associated ferredoxin
MAVMVMEGPGVYVCHCRVVNDRHIRAIIEAGASTPAEVARACGAGATCGGCVPLIRRLLSEQAERLCALPCPVAEVAVPAADRCA